MQKIGFIGAGKMAEAIVDGLLIKSFNSKEISCFSPGNSAQKLSQRTGIIQHPNLKVLIAEADLIVLACKPQHLNDLDPTLNTLLKGKLLVSLLAGVPLDMLSQKFSEANAIVRLMPNTPVQIGEGMNCFCTQSPLSKQQSEQLQSFLSPLGTNFEIDESKLDNFMAVWACGPAYVFEFIAGLRDAAINFGFDDHQATLFSKQMVHGAAALAFKSDQSPDELRNAVASKGGATQAGLDRLAENNFRSILSEATVAAKDHVSKLVKPAHAVNS